MRSMVTYEHGGKTYVAERIEQKDGFFIAFNVTCEGKRYERILVRNDK